MLQPYKQAHCNPHHCLNALVQFNAVHAQQGLQKQGPHSHDPPKNKDAKKAVWASSSEVRHLRQSGARQPKTGQTTYWACLAFCSFLCWKQIGLSCYRALSRNILGAFTSTSKSFHAFASTKTTSTGPSTTLGHQNITSRGLQLVISAFPSRGEPQKGEVYKSPAEAVRNVAGSCKVL